VSTTTPLKPGDLLRVVSPSGALRELNAFELGVEIWRSRGYQVEFSTGIEQRWGYLAGCDGERRNQLLSAGKTQNVAVSSAPEAVMAAQNLEDWTWPQVEPPKWLISDITALLWSLSGSVFQESTVLLTTLAAEPDWSIQRLFDWAEGRSLAPLKGTGWGGGIATGIPTSQSHRCHPSTRHPSPTPPGWRLRFGGCNRGSLPHRPTADAVALVGALSKSKALHWGALATVIRRQTFLV